MTTTISFKTAPLTLLDDHDADVIRAITADLSAHTNSFRNAINIPIFVAYQGEGTLKPATGRATCRLCNEKIKKDGVQLSFYYDAENNSWTAKEYHVHANGC